MHDGVTAGTDEKVIWKILTGRTNAQRQRISAEYSTIYGRVRMIVKYSNYCMSASYKGHLCMGPVKRILHDKGGLEFLHEIYDSFLLVYMAGLLFGCFAVVAGL